MRDDAPLPAPDIALRPPHAASTGELTGMALLMLIGSMSSASEGVANETARAQAAGRGYFMV